ncbi:stress response protein NhaX-like isoform X3 [Hydractinia symbiolongicarpus]|uniref:stress response protein NhaX-like isoform X3 n=1 Tax=Hydractinia symbiolongicarpus TaxID=13093 RepID=UPI00254EFA3B|nr:stress response protein NhaX-like isoform X3 [Hydractinia symbiolongicarpus]
MAEADKKKTVVLIAIDESQHSRRAFDYYQNEVADENHEVILVHMFTPPAPPAMSSKAMKVAGKEERSNRHHSHPFGHDFFLSDTGSEHWKKWRAKVEHKINELKKLLTTYEEICDEHRIMNRAILHSGDPGEGICELAKENEVDLIIIGSRGLNKLRRTFLGSVSDFVIRESGKSVLVVPPK